MYSEKIMDDLMNKMTDFLNDHPIYKLMELVASAIATKEQQESKKEYEIKIEKMAEGVIFSWGDAPILGVDVDHDGNIRICPKDGTEGTFKYKLVGDVEYVKNTFKL